MPKISILIPYYNDELFLQESIQSVLNQSYTDFELVLINHACTDSSRSIAHSFNDNRIVHIDLSTNAGAGGGVILDAFLKVAKGTFLKLFCADDIMYENYLEKCLAFLKETPSVDFCFSNEGYIDEEGKMLPSDFYTDRTEHIVNSDDWSFAAITDYYHMVSNLPFSSCFLRKSCFENIKIDFTIVMMFDMSIFLQMLLNGKNIGFIKEKLISYRIHEGQISSSANKKKCIASSFFEHIVFMRIFFETENIQFMQRLLNRTDLSSLENLRIELAKFWMSLPVVTFQIAAYQWLHDYLQDAEHRDDERVAVACFRNLYQSSELAYRCLETNEWYNALGIKGIFKIFMKKCIRKFLPHTKKLSHL